MSPSVVFRELDGEAVILDLESGTYFGLDPVGTRVWALLREHGALDKVCAHMMDEFDVTADVLERDVRALVDELRAKRLIMASAPSAGAD